jgi:peptidoglycan/LPS O-acetylase OafA/YrhL
MVLAVLLRREVHAAVAGASAWLNLHGAPIGVGDVLRDPLMIELPTFPLNSVLWSLRWEIVFSAALPFVVLALPLIARWWPTVLVLMLALVASAPWLPASEWFAYLPVFGVGVVLASIERRARVVATALSEHRAAAWCVAVLAVTSRWWLVGHEDAAGITEGVVRALVLVGAAGIVVLVLVGTADRCMRARPVSWLGSRSYSLYLVHEPIVVTLALAGAVTALSPVFVATAVASSLAAAELFHRLVERPAVALAATAARSTARVDRHAGAAALVSSSRATP